MKSEKKILIDWCKKSKNSVDINNEQQKFIKENYIDENYIIGIHNSERDYESFFEKGIYNNTSLVKPTLDLSNTVMYNDLLLPLMQYANGDGQKRGKTAIILKIPKDVFKGEAGIFAKLENGQYCIPPEFIVGALQDGKVIENDRYSQEHNNEQLLKCNNKIPFQKKRLNLEVYEAVFNKPSLNQIIKNFFGRNNKKQKLLPETKQNTVRKTQEEIRDLKVEVNEEEAIKIVGQKRTVEEIGEIER